MTTLDDFWPPAEPTAVETPRKHRHVWVETVDKADYAAQGWMPVVVVCKLCGRERDETKARRGKSSRRLGHDGERRSEKRYGWSKVGEFGGITDLQGALFVVQQKTSRRPVPALWRSIFAALEGRSGGRIPLILLSFVRAGVDTEDVILVRGRDWLALHGKDEALADPTKGAAG